MAEAMLARGVYVIGFSYPVVPKGKARIRVQVSAAHTPRRPGIRHGGVRGGEAGVGDLRGRQNCDLDQYCATIPMSQKNFRIPAKDIKRLVAHDGGCFATDRITIDGRPVGYMYREPPDHDADTGWRFTAGDESDEYMDNPDNLAIYSVNTITNYTPDILPYINAPIGSAFARNPDTDRLEPVESPVDPTTACTRISPSWKATTS